MKYICMTKNPTGSLLRIDLGLTVHELTASTSGLWLCHFFFFSKWIIVVYLYIDPCSEAVAEAGLLSLVIWLVLNQMPYNCKVLNAFCTSLNKLKKHTKKTPIIIIIIKLFPSFALIKFLIFCPYPETVIKSQFKSTIISGYRFS